MGRALIISGLVVAAAAVLVGGQFVLDDRGTYHALAAATVIVLCVAFWILGASSSDAAVQAAVRHRKISWLLVSTALLVGLGVLVSYQAEVSTVLGFDVTYGALGLTGIWLLWSVGFLSIFAANILAIWVLPFFPLAVAFWGPSALGPAALITFLVTLLGPFLVLRCPRCQSRTFRLMPFEGAPWTEACDRCGLSFHEHSYLDPDTKALRTQWRARQAV